MIARCPFSPLRALPVVALLALAGCDGTGFFAYPMQARGAQVDAEQLKQLVPGTSTRQDVSALLGTPTAKATFDESVSTFKAVSTAKSVKEAMDLQSSFAKAALEKAMAESNKLTDASIKLTEQTLAPITARMTTAVETFGKSA